MLSIHNILVPFDFSDPSKLALRHALELAETHDADVDLLHVIEEPRFPSFYNAGSVALYGHAPKVEEQAKEAMQALLADLPSAGGRGYGVHVRQGLPAEEILRMAEEHDAELIVMGAFGMSGFSSLLLGSVADRVLRRAPCPVFLIRPDGKSLLADEPQDLSSD